MPDWQWHAPELRRRGDLLAHLLRSPDARERYRRDRFWKLAIRYTLAVTVRDRVGNRVTLNTADPWISRETFIAGSFDPTNVDNVIAVLAERGYIPEQIIDVGANIGTSMLELLAAYPDASGICIEPHPGNYSLLRQNVIANALEDRVRTINAAVGAFDGEASLTVNPHNPGDHQIGGFVGEETITVPMRRLGDLVELDRPTLLWIDVQGYEGHVFRGAGDLVGCPALVEFWPRRLREIGGYAAFLEGASRYATVLEAQRELRPAGDLNELAGRLEAQDRYTDLLLLP